MHLLCDLLLLNSSLAIGCCGSETQDVVDVPADTSTDDVPQFDFVKAGHFTLPGLWMCECWNGGCPFHRPCNTMQP